MKLRLGQPPPSRGSRPSVQSHPAIVCNFKPVMTTDELRRGGSGEVARLREADESVTGRPLGSSPAGPQGRNRTVDTRVFSEVVWCGAVSPTGPKHLSLRTDTVWAQ